MTETTNDANTREICIYKLEDGSWKWDVYCNGQWIAGNVENTKREAKREADRYRCESLENGDITPDDDTEISITAPHINANIENGSLIGSDFINPWTNEMQHFSANEISENELAWLAGLCFFDHSASQDCELLIAKLKVWNVYLGGNSMQEIQNLHNLSENQCNMILNKDWNSVTITKTTCNNETIHLDWNFVS